ncbi:MAG: phosphatidylinositol 3 and 4-kinase-domain-containing protein [Monoraphidium minutum]|nr:MAG: phosphatidylinositol 3 and 4-kinase-domain-containing protein [Monoraphidium minutum]
MTPLGCLSRCCADRIGAFADQHAPLPRAPPLPQAMLGVSSGTPAMQVRVEWDAVAGRSVCAPQTRVARRARISAAQCVRSKQHDCSPPRCHRDAPLHGSTPWRHPCMQRTRACTSLPAAGARRSPTPRTPPLPRPQASLGTGAAASSANSGSSSSVPFVTTYGFTTTHGFSLPGRQQPGEQGGGLEAPEQQQQLEQRQPGKDEACGDSQGLPAREADSVRSCSSISTTTSTAAAAGAALALRVPSTSDNTLGWRGMLEASKAAVGSGVLGAITSAEAGRAARVDLVCTAHATPGVRRLVKSVVRGLKACQDPQRMSEGMGGSYACMNEAGRRVAIFKPCDEEPLAPNNPKGYVGRTLGDAGWKPTVRVGEAALREVAAYLLDHGGFSKVPHTTLVRAAHPNFHYASTQHLLAGGCDGEGGGGGEGGLPPKLGSLQEFVSHISDTSELGSGRLARRDVHRIGILDIRLFNTDRHAGNILVCNPAPEGAATPDGATDAARRAPSRAASRLFGGPGLPPAPGAAPYDLVPIDHGFCLPEALEPPYFEWLHWPQAMLPFEQAELDYIAALDAAADVGLLRSELPALRPQCLRVLQVGTVFLQRCAAAGLSLAAMGHLMSRPLDALEDDDSNPSELERACVAARQAVETAALLGPGAPSLDGSVAGLTLQEGDEEGEDDAAEPPGGDAASDEPDGGAPGGRGAAGGGGGGERGPAGAGAAGGGGLVALMFDLEPEGDGSTSGSSDPPRSGSSDLAAPASPFSQVSIDSLGSGNGGGGGGGGGMSVGLGAPPALGGGLGVARSVYASGGFMWRPPPKAGLRTQSPRRALGARAAYPPPVVAAPPRSTSEVLSGLGEEQWAAFMGHLAAIIDDHLRSGAWRQAGAAPTSVAMSCPRF